MDLEAEMLTGRKQVKTGQRERLSERTPYRVMPGVMRQSDLAENELQEGESKNSPRQLDLCVGMDFFDLAMKFFPVSVLRFGGFLAGFWNRFKESPKNCDLVFLSGWQNSIFKNVQNVRNFGLLSNTPNGDRVGFRFESLIVLVIQHSTKLLMDVYQNSSVIIPNANLDSWQQSQPSFWVNTPSGNSNITFAPKETTKFCAPHWVKQLFIHKLIIAEAWVELQVGQ